MSRNQKIGYLVILALLGGGAKDAVANPTPAQLCLQAAQVASDQTGVPFDVLYAIALTETGRNITGSGPEPWPWASNQGGDGNWHASRSEAVAMVEARLAEGVTNIDLGCFQLNHRWHGEHFASVDAMFDPLANALYAAQLLKRHYDRLGDWSAAAGAYHSGTPEYAERYRVKFEQHYTADSDLAELPLAVVMTSPRENKFPLLLAGSRAAGPSLFPALSAGPRLIGD